MARSIVARLHTSALKLQLKSPMSKLMHDNELTGVFSLYGVAEGRGPTAVLLLWLKEQPSIEQLC